MRERVGSPFRAIAADARHYQIMCLATLLGYGVWRLHFDVRPGPAISMVVAALATQWIFTRVFGLPRFDFRSPLISALSLCLLLRTSLVSIAVLAAFITIASKFLIRWNGKHVFNPTNFGIVALLLVTDKAWVSSGQWGSGAWVAFLLACLGGLVVNRAARADISLSLLACYSAVLFGRAAWLGDPIAIPLHQLQNGALLIFAFFMISDPKTTPDSRVGRFLFAALVAGVAGWITFGLFVPNGFLYALAAIAPSAPVIDWLLPGQRHEWPAGGLERVRRTKGGQHEPSSKGRIGGHPVPDVLG